MGAVGDLGQVAAGDLVRALRAGLDAAEAALDGEFDGAVVAQLEMQEGVVLQTAPVAAEQRIAAHHVEGAGDGAPLARRQDQHDAFAERRAEPVEEIARQIGIAPFAVARRGITGEERVPVRRLDVVARQRLDGQAAAQRGASLAPDRLALA